MALISDDERRKVWRSFMASPQGSLSCLKDDIRAAVDAADGWMDSSWAEFNASLPAGFRTTATRKQKARLLAEVIEARFKVDA